MTLGRLMKLYQAEQQGKQIMMKEYRCGYSESYENIEEIKLSDCSLSTLVLGDKDGGVIVWVVNDQTKNGGETGTSFKQVLHFMELGLKLNDTMIWRKTNPMPQVKQPRYSPCFEYMFVLSKGKPKTFNPLMRKTKCGGVKYDSTCKNMGGESGRTKKNFTIKDEAVDYNVWDIAISQNKTKHPAVFPEELAMRHVKSWTNEGDVVLDPFIGSGTTAIVCKKNNRNCIGFEISKEYYDECVNRL